MLKIFAFLIAFFLVMLTYQNCGPGLESIVENTEPAASLGTTTFTSLYQGIIVPQCLSCHSGSTLNGGVDLSSYDAIMSSGIVVPGEAVNSSLYYEVSTGSMPPSTPLVQNSIKAFRDWINGGALND